MNLCAGWPACSALAAVGPYCADRSAHRANPAFALLIGDGLAQLRRAPGEQVPARIILQDGLVCLQPPRPAPKCHQSEAIKGVRY